MWAKRVGYGDIPPCLEARPTTVRRVDAQSAHPTIRVAENSGEYMNSEHGKALLARRDFIAAGAASLGWLVAGKTSAAAAVNPSDHPASANPRSSVNALFFDVFGTVVDWRGSIIRERELLGQRKGIEVDWMAFADAWRAGYQPAMKRVRSGQIPWTNIDGLHRLVLDAPSSTGPSARQTPRRTAQASRTSSPATSWISPHSSACSADSRSRKQS